MRRVKLLFSAPSARKTG